MKNKYLFLVLIFFVPLLKVSAASISITEIMYDLEGTDTAHEWIEVYNNSGSTIDLTKYKFVESGTAHSISHFEGSTDLLNGEYAIIADNPNNFLTDYPNQSKTQIYDSSFSLSNDKGESLSLKDPDGNIVYEITYDVSIGANGDGKSLQFTNSWTAQTPTPLNSNSDNTNNTNNNKNTKDTTTDAVNIVDNTKNTGGLGYIPYQKDPEMIFNFTVPKLATVGTNVEYKAILFGYSGERISAGRFVWNFGDGDIVEDVYLKNVFHQYNYAGNYTVSLTFRYNWYAEPVAIGKFVIKIVDSPLVLKEYYDNPKPAIKLANTKDGEYNIGGYIIKTGIKDFKIPEDTFISGNDEIILNLPLADYNKNEIKLMHETGYLVSEFSSSIQNNLNQNTNTIIYKTNSNYTKPVEYFNSNENQNYINDNKNLKTINLSASAANANNNKNYLVYGSLFFVIIFSSGIIFYIKHKNKNNDTNNADDYSLQDE